MSAELEMLQDGKAAMAYRANGGVPWHGLGVPLPENATPQEMMEAANLNWTVSKTPEYIKADGEFIETGRFALIRDTDHRVLTHVSGGWMPVQNSDAFDFFTDLVAKGDMQMETAGSLFDGRVVWAQANLKDGFEVVSGDEIKGYLLFTNPHVYGRSVQVAFVQVRTVCNNTLVAALRTHGGRIVKLNHAKKFDATRVKEMMGISHEIQNELKEKYKVLVSRKINEDKLKAYFGKVFGRDEKGELKRNGRVALEAFETQPGWEFGKGTYYQAFNTITYCQDHVFGRMQDNRLESSWYGDGKELKLKALQSALDMSA